MELEDKEKINQILTETLFPARINFDQLKREIQGFSLKNWTAIPHDYSGCIQRNGRFFKKENEQWMPIRYERKCWFCERLTDKITYRNEYFNNIISCSDCYTYIKDDKPGDHPVNKGIHRVICNWINKHYWEIVPYQRFLVDQKCTLCHKIIEGKEKEVLITSYAISHLGCPTIHQFFSEEDCKEIIQKLLNNKLKIWRRGEDD